MKIRGNIKSFISPLKLDKDKGRQMANFHFMPQNRLRPIKCSGFILPFSLDDFIELEGEMVGGEFRVVNSYHVDTTQAGASSLLKFLFGKKTSIKIVTHFSESPISAVTAFKNREEYFRNECERIKGISQKKIDKAYLKYSNNATAEFLFNEFQGYGLTLELALKIYSYFGESALNKIKTNPYSLLNIYGITFPFCDEIAMKYCEWCPFEKKRIWAGILFILLQNETAGHTYMKLEEKEFAKEKTLLGEVVFLLKVDVAIVFECLIDLERGGKIVTALQGSYKIVYRYSMYTYEEGISNSLKALVGPSTLKLHKIDEQIDEFERKNGFKLAKQQVEAIRVSCLNRCSVITGPPGSGKTTIIDAICTTLNNLSPEGLIIKLAAPTGKAANRIFESTSIRAETVHRLLKYSPKDNSFTFNEKNKLPVGVLILDEVSMLGLKMTYNLLKALPERCHLILVGDYNQLPSVDAGKILEDIIHSDCVPKTMLNEIYRQKPGSTLAQKTLDIASSKTPSLSSSSDFKFIQATNTTESINECLEQYSELTKRYTNGRVAVLTPMNKGDTGVHFLNEIIQNRVNPCINGGLEIVSGKRRFRLSDRVIQLVNEASLNVFNGMVGTIVEISPKRENEEEYIVVDYGAEEVKYTRDKYDNIQLAYALTIHKTQGSEYDGVIMMMCDEHKIMLTKKLLYTGVSRAKKKLILIGNPELFKYGINNTQEVSRNSLLDRKIKMKFGLI